MSHYDDEAQLDQLKQWWRENWRALATGLALGLGGIFGWQFWQGHAQRVAADASQLYEDLRKVDKLDAAQPYAQKLFSSYAETPYASQAALRLAQLEAGEGKFDEALKHLEWVIEHSDDEGLKHVARLRQARILVQVRKPEEALKLTEVQGMGKFEPLYLELRGDIKLAQGDRSGAAEAYRKAMTAGAEADDLRQKLEDLADIKATAS
jgi:predicted negative regulator of RcsB-dependent stress response